MSTDSSSICKTIFMLYFSLFFLFCWHFYSSNSISWPRPFSLFQSVFRQISPQPLRSIILLLSNCLSCSCLCRRQLSLRSEIDETLLRPHSPPVFIRLSCPSRRNPCSTSHPTWSSAVSPGYSWYSSLNWVSLFNSSERVLIIGNKTRVTILFQLVWWRKISFSANKTASSLHLSSR